MRRLLRPDGAAVPPAGQRYGGDGSHAVWGRAFRASSSAAMSSSTKRSMPFCVFAELRTKLFEYLKSDRLSADHLRASASVRLVRTEKWRQPGHSSACCA